MSAAEKNDDAPRDDPPALKEALRLLSEGLWPIPITAPEDSRDWVKNPGKQPASGKGWGLSRPTEQSLRAFWSTYPWEAGVGIKLGKAAGVIDIEVDDPETGPATLDSLFGGEVIVTRGWSSWRGSHHLFRWDDRLIRYGKTVIEKDERFPGLGLRFGSPDNVGKQQQSVCPPSLTTSEEDDQVIPGEPRHWNGVDVIADLPGSVFDYLDSILLADSPVDPPPTIPFSGPRPGSLPPIERARAYLAKVPPAISGEGGHNQAIKTACNVGPGFGLSEADTLLVLREWNQTCQPPWSEKELRHKVSDAFKREKRRGWLLEKDSKTFDRRESFGGSAGSGGESRQETNREERPWRRPRFNEPTRALPFPLDALPVSLAELCRTGAAALQCPVDYLAGSAIALAGAAIGMSVNLRLKAGFVVPPHLYVAIVGLPGSKKSPAVFLMGRPFADIDRELDLMYRQEKAAHDEKVREYEASRRKGDTGPPPVPPLRKQLTFDDVTREALALIHGENPRGLVGIRDELFGWVASLNAYKAGGKGDDRQFWLSINSGMPSKVNRKGGDRTPIVLSRPCITLVGGLTPAMLPGVRGGTSADDGWLDRILFSYPDAVPEGDWSEDVVPDDLIRDWDAAVRRLWSRPMHVNPMTGERSSLVVGLREDARPVWVDWYNVHQSEKTHRDFPSSLRGPWSKMEGFAGRLALILSQLHHAYDAEEWPPLRDPLFADPDEKAPDPPPPIPADPLHVHGATRLADYFKSHFRRAVRELSPRGWSVPDDPHAIVKWVRHSGRESFSERDAKKNFEGRFGRDPVAFADAVDWLVGHDCIRPAPHDQATGRPHSPIFEVNPYVLDPRFGEPDDPAEPDDDVPVRDDPQNGQNPQNSAGESTSGGFGGFAGQSREGQTAVDWLQAWLDAGMSWPETAIRRGTEAGYSADEIRAAAVTLDVPTRRRRDREWWGLPDAPYWDCYQDWED
jgi:hypothetical protein